MTMTNIAVFPLLDDLEVCTVIALPGDRLATGHNQGTIRVWALDGELQETLLGHGRASVPALASTPSGDIVSGSTDDTVKVWRGSTCIHTCTGHTHSINALAVSPLDGTVVSASTDFTARVWSLTTGACVATLKDHWNIVWTVCVLSNGDIVTGSWDNSVRVWDRATLTSTAVYRQPDIVRSVVPLPGAGFLVAGGSNHIGFVAAWWHGAVEWTMKTEQHVETVDAQNGDLFVCTPPGVLVIRDGHQVGRWSALFPRVAALPDGRVALLESVTGGRKISVLGVGRRSRLATIHLMVTVWATHGGVPPPLPDTPPNEAVVGRSLSLRRFCRPRADTWEVVEPFARAIASFL